MNKINYNKIERAWMISDIHFGVRSSSLEWLNIHKDYFYNFFIPLLKDKKKDGDYLFILGDVFESRQSLNILVLNEVFKIFKKLSEIMPIIIIVGNHDIYRKQTNEVHSSIIFDSFDNIEVLTKPKVFQTKFKSIFMMPWVEDKSTEIEIIRNNPADYMFCHTDFLNMKYNRKITIEEGLNPNVVNKYKKVYAGHIHYSQHIKNIRMIGSPLQLTRSDIYNDKYIYLLDFKTDTEVRFINNYSPKFLKFNIDDILDVTFDEMKKIVKNNFIDIIVDSKWSAKFPFARFSDYLTGYKRINYILSSLTKDYEDENYNGEEIELEDLIKIHIDNLPYTDKTKEKLYEVSMKLFRKTIKLTEEKEI